MLLTEWDWDEARAVWREEGREEGREERRKEVHEEGRKKGRRERAAELLAMIDAGCGIEELRARIEAERGVAGVRCAERRGECRNFSEIYCPWHTIGRKREAGYYDGGGASGADNGRLSLDAVEGGKP